MLAAAEELGARVPVADVGAFVVGVAPETKAVVEAKLAVLEEEGKEKFRPMLGEGWRAKSAGAEMN